MFHLKVDLLWEPNVFFWQVSPLFLSAGFFDSSQCLLAVLFLQISMSINKNIFFFIGKMVVTFQVELIQIFRLSLLLFTSIMFRYIKIQCTVLEVTCRLNILNVVIDVCSIGQTSVYICVQKSVHVFPIINEWKGDSYKCFFQIYWNILIKLD